MYRDSLLLYVDILGWSNAIQGGKEDARLLQVVELIHSHAEVHNERIRQECLARDGKNFRINPLFLDVQFGAFSDHFVYSIPVGLGARIVSMASKLTIDLLRMGWLTRGAIVRGSLYHKDNIVFGPALLEAVSIEATVAVFPRILLSAGTMDLLSDHAEGSAEKSFIKDQLDQYVVNPFCRRFEVTDPVAQELLKSFVAINFGFAEIRPMLDEQIETHTRAQRIRQADKWAYLRDFITGPVFAETPELKEFW